MSAEAWNESFYECKGCHKMTIVKEGMCGECFAKETERMAETQKFWYDTMVSTVGGKCENCEAVTLDGIEHKRWTKDHKGEEEYVLCPKCSTRWNAIWRKLSEEDREKQQSWQREMHERWTRYTQGIYYQQRKRGNKKNVTG